jgi:thiamine-phosphate pyrophosphorylase
MKIPNRCRLVLVIPEDLADPAMMLENALAGGDIASIIIHSSNEDEGTFQTRCEKLTSVAQNAGVAVIIANDTRIAGRCNADGIHIDLPGGNAGVPELAEAVEKYSPTKMVGGGAVKSRHMALSLGEASPDYLFFGRLNSDIKPQAHAKMLSLAEWWAQMVEIPGICMGGNELDSAIEVAKTGIDFIALSSAIFSHEEGAELAVKLVNQLLDQYAPEFEDV